MLVRVLWQEKGEFHSRFCEAQGYCRNRKDPTPCGFEGTDGQAWTHPYDRARGDHSKKYKDCFANHIDPSHFDYIFLYGFYKDGFLPFEGALADQDAKYVQAMRVIASETNRIEAEEMERRKSEQESKAKK